MGAPWSYYDPFTGALRFLYLSQGYTHFHEEAYIQFEDWQTERCGVVDAVKDVKQLLEPWRRRNLVLPAFSFAARKLTVPW